MSNFKVLHEMALTSVLILKIENLLLLCLLFVPAL